jgi:predicted glutamine amidotransferase
MCRLLFYAGESKYSAPILEEFIYNATYDAFHENEPCLDGYGFAWGDAAAAGEKLHIYKSPKPFYKDDNYKNAIARAGGGAARKIIVGHVRRERPDITSYRALASLNNTHPFQFGEHVFVHNGYIYEFEKHRNFILSHIDTKYHKHIKGKTDSEHIFYLFLSHLGSLATSENIKLAWKKIITLFRGEKIHAILNTIYVGQGMVAITRYVISGRINGKYISDPHPLYISRGRGRGGGAAAGEILVSSRPLFGLAATGRRREPCRMITKNKIFISDI